MQSILNDREFILSNLKKNNIIQQSLNDNDISKNTMQYKLQVIIKKYILLRKKIKSINNKN
jgi:hypothetical protein